MDQMKWVGDFMCVPGEKTVGSKVPGEKEEERGQENRKANKDREIDR